MCDGRGERKDREGEGGRGITKEVNLYRRVMERRTGQQIIFFQLDRILLYVPDLFPFSINADFYSERYEHDLLLILPNLKT